MCYNVLYFLLEDIVGSKLFLNCSSLKENVDIALGNLRETVLKFPPKKAKKLAYWIDDWARKYLPHEGSFKYNTLKKYKRGDLIKAELGFKIGAEYGGLHYCVVIENNNTINNGTIIVVPLTSLKDGKTEADLDPIYELYLGSEIFKSELSRCVDNAIKIQSEIRACSNNDKLMLLEKKLLYLEKEMNNYRKATAAKIGQVCALSKMRIVFPKYNGDKLSSCRLDDKMLDKIDERIRCLLTKQ
jgi:uncharacterized protein YifN (PemK superfamily)